MRLLAGIRRQLSTLFEIWPFRKRLMRKALVVGIDDYTGAPLHCCVRDANAMESVLSFHEDGSRDFDVNLYENIKTKADLLKGIRELFSGDGDVALLYFAGHGTKVGTDGYLVLPDYSDGNEGVRVSEILEQANKSRFKSKIIVLDCCYSGTVTDPDPNLNHVAPIGKGVVILAACSEEESAKENAAHGVFTQLLLDGLRGGASNILGEVTPSLLFGCIDKMLGPWEQRPLFAANVSRHIVLRKTQPAIDIKLLRQLPRLFPESQSLFSLDPSYEPTNIKGGDHKNQAPYANEVHCKVFADLQALVKVGLVVPVDAQHMYFAAMNSKSCKLTPMGEYYWMLAKKNRL